MKKKIDLKQEENLLHKQIKQFRYVLIFAVLLISVITFNHQYNLDDNLVTNNHPLTSRGIEAISEIFTSNYFVDDMGHSYGYRPIVMISFAIEHQIFGDNPAMSHVINTVLYLITTLLFFKLLIRTFDNKHVMFSGIAALIFAIHPVHSEVLASIKNRDEILALLFSLLAGVYLLKYITKNSINSLFFAFLFFTIGLLAKKSVFPLAIILPLMLMLFNKVSIKQFFIIQLVLMLPAVVIGSELNPERLILLTILIIIVSMTILFVLYKRQSDYFNLSIQNSFRDKIFNYAPPVLITLSVVAGFLFDKPFFIVISLPFLFVDSKFVRIHYLLYSLSLIFISSFFSIDWIGKLGMLFVLWITIRDWISIKKVDYFHLIICLIACSTFITIPAFLLQNLILIVVMSLVLIGIYFGTVFKILSFILLLVFAIFSSDLYLSISLFIILFTQLVTFPKFHFSVNLVTKSFLVTSISLFSIVNFVSLDRSLKADNASNKIEWQENLNTIKEGRPLTYVENTLVKDKDAESKIATGFYSIGMYMKMMVVPTQLSYYYGYAKVQTSNFKSLYVWLSILSIALLFLLAWIKLKSKPELSLGILWFIFSILIFSNWFELVAGMVAERLAFTASIGVSLILSAIIFWIIPKFNLFKPLGKDWIVLGVFVFLIGLTINRNYLWKDFDTLMTHDLKYLDQSAQAHNLYALGIMNSIHENNYAPNEIVVMKQKALSHFSKAVEIYPYFFNAQFDKGRVLAELGDFKGAFLEFKKARKINPKNPIVLEELVKSSFESKMHKEVLKYGMQYIKNEQASELIYELVAYSCLLNHDFSRCEMIASEGASLFPQNPNMPRMIMDAKNKVVL